jgi:Tfp pilus assembly protein PilV
LDVKEEKMQDARYRKPEGGFTLIESVVAMGLFVGVVFLLVGVFNEFLIDDYTNKLNKAAVIAENQIEKVGKSKNFESVNRDTIGFHITQTVTMRDGVALVNVAIEDPLRGMSGTKKIRTQYIKLTKAFPAN